MGLAERYRRERSSQLTKWSIFGVLLPLLPIACKILAQWIDTGEVKWSLSALCGDGELLVIATVVAAAGIGDLVFDLRRGKRSRGRRDSTAIALALICVIVSVTLYALVTLKREQLTPAQETLSRSADIRNSQAGADQRTFQDAQRQLLVAQAQANRALAVYQAEVTGRGPSGVPGLGVLARKLLIEYEQAKRTVAALQQQVSSAQETFSASRQLATRSLLQANEALAGKVPLDERRSATASLVMFMLGLLAGLNCLLAGTVKSQRRRKAPGQGRNEGPTRSRTFEHDGVPAGPPLRDAGSSHPQAVG